MYQHRNLLKTHFFRTACRTFGPPKSMIRRIIAPSMEKVVSAADSDGMIHGVPSCCIKSERGSESMNHHKIAMVPRYGMISENGSQRIQNQDTKSIMSCTEWISARKKLHAQIDSMGNLNKWLEGKSDLNELEKRAYYKILDKHAQSYLSNVPTENMVLDWTMANEVSLQDGQISEEDVLKKYQHRDLLKTHFFRTACRTFGPPKSMIRRIIAPSMEKVVSAADSDGMIHGVPSCCIKSESGSESMNHHKIAMVCRYGMISEYGSQRIQNQDTKSIMSCTEWISARKKLHAQIDSMGNLNKWLEGKSDLNELEKRAYYKILDKHAQSYLPNVPTENMVLGDKSQNAECQAQKSGKCRFARPTIQKPNLAVLGILDGYLHQRQMRLVDLYNQTDKRKRKKLSINDLIAVRKEAKLPISDQQFDSLIVSLSSKSPNSVDYQELSKAWHVWKTENRKESRSDITTKSEVSVPSLENVHKVAQSTVSDSSERVIRQESPPGYSESSGSQLLHVPPISMEESRPLSYEDMEEIGKHYRERNRRAKSNTRLLDWLEQCRVIRTGNMAVDSHSMPSTLGGDLEMGDLVDNFRMKSLQQYHKILKLCRDYGVSLSEKLLERALLHPGDKLIRASGQQLWIHQPGTDAFCRQYLLKADSSMKNSWGSQDLERSSRPGFHSTPSSVPYPHDTYVKRVKAKVRGRAEVRTETIDCWTTFEQFQEMTSNLKKRYPHRFLTSNDNDFWPGHLLDKLCIYLPKVTWRDTAPS